MFWHFTGISSPLMHPGDTSWLFIFCQKPWPRTRVTRPWTMSLKMPRKLKMLILHPCQRLLTISLHLRAAFHYFLLYRHTTVNPRNPSCRSHATITRPSFLSAALSQRPHFSSQELPTPDLVFLQWNLLIYLSVSYVMKKLRTRRTGWLRTQYFMSHLDAVTLHAVWSAASRRWLSSADG